MVASSGRMKGRARDVSVKRDISASGENGHKNEIGTCVISSLMAFSPNDESG